MNAAGPNTPDRRAAPAPQSPCTTTPQRLACAGLRPTGYRDSAEHRRCEVAGCGFGAWVAVRVVVTAGAAS